MSVVSGRFLLVLLLLSCSTSTLLAQDTTERERRATLAAQRRAEAETARDAERQNLLQQLDLEEKALDTTLSSSARWVMLPPYVTDVHVDSAGVARFSQALSYDLDPIVFAKLAERISSGGASVLRGGQLHLVDSKGRFWLTCASEKHQLRCYDRGKLVETRLASGEAELPKGIPTGEFYRGVFEREAFEDKAGNLFFIGGASNRLGVGIHRRSPAGDWSYHQIREPNKQDDYFDGKPAFEGLAGDRVVIYPRVHRGNRLRETARVLSFDGQNWTVVDPRVCKEHDVRSIMPLKNGTIATLCDGGRLWLYALAIAPEQVKARVDELVAQLSDPDIERREAATGQLLAHGSQVLSVLQAIDSASVLPEAMLRIHDIVESIASSEDAGHSHPVLYGGRYRFANCYQVSRTPDGGYRFYVKHCVDRRDNALFHDAYAVCDASGDWTASEIPTAQWDEAGVPPTPEHRFEDSLGGVWLLFGLRSSPKDDTASPVAPHGLSLDLPVAEDRQGRIYVRTERGSLAMYDRTAPDPVGALPRKEFPAETIVRVGASRRAWARQTGRMPQLLCIGPGGTATAAPPAQADTWVGDLIALDGGCIALLMPPNPREEFVEKPYALWDGSGWVARADTLADLVHNNAATVAKLADSSFGQACSRKLDHARLARTADGGLWFWTEGYEPTANGQAMVHRLEYYDGKTWHNAWSDLGITGNPKALPLGAVNGGRAILLDSNTRREVELVEYVDGVIHRKKVLGRSGDFGRMARCIIPGPGTRTWIEPITYLAGIPVPTIFQLDGDSVTDLKLPHRLLGADAAGRLWTVDMSKAPKVYWKSDAAAGDLSVQAADSGSSMVQSSDGRIWLLTINGPVELAVEAGVAKERRRGTWGWPLDDFSRCFCDDVGGLWIWGEGNGLTRYDLLAAE